MRAPSVLFLISILSAFQAFAGELRISSIRAQEATKSFSIDVDFSTDDYYRSKLSFDSIELYKFVAVSPSVKYTISADRRGFLLIGDFQPNTSYEITLKEGLVSTNGDALKKSQTRTVTTGDFRPQFKFASSALYVPSRFQASLPWESINLGEMAITVRRVYRQNLHDWSGSSNAHERNSDIVLEKTLDVSGTKNEVKRGVFSLNELQPMGKGVYEVTFKATGKDLYVSDKASVIVTDLSAVLKKTDSNELRVWVLGTDKLDHISNAEVLLLSKANRTIGQCKTSWFGGDCSINWKDDKANNPHAVVIQKGNDQTYITLANATLENDRYQAGTRSYAAVNGQFDIFVYSERDLYRPGETVHLAANARNAELLAAPNLALAWKITGPRGKVIKEAVSTTSDFGLSFLDFPTASVSDTGSYTAAIFVGEKEVAKYSFLVEEFVPERIKVTMKAGKSHYVNEKIASFDIQADYLFGTPVANGEWKASCSLKPAFNEVPKNSGYKTGVYRDSAEIISIDAITGTLDATGGGKVNCNYGERQVSKLPEVYRLSNYVLVNEAGSGRATAQTGTALISSSPSIVGMALEKSESRTIKVKGGYFDLDGNALNSSGEVKLSLYEVNYNWYYDYDDGGYYNWKSNKTMSPSGVEKVIKINGGKFQEEISVPSNSWGEWLVRAEDTKTGYVADLFVGYVGYGWSRHQGPSNGRALANELDLRIDKTEIKVGETFDVLITAPFAGKVLVSIEGDRIFDQKWIEVKSPGVQKLTLKAPDMTPNFYVTGLLLKTPLDGQNYIPARAWGARSVKVLPEKYLVDVEINHPELSKSRQAIEIKLSNKQKAQVTYSLALVDEGILQISKFKSPSPREYFFEPRKMGTMTYETLGSTFNLSADLPGGGGPGEAGGQKQMPVDLVSFWLGNLKSDSSGNAKAKIDLPAFQGKLRLMAVAHGKNQMGSAESFMTVRDPIIIQPTLPRFLTTGDDITVPVSITNASGKDQKVTVEIKGNSLVNIAQPSITKSLKDKAQEVVKFSIKVRDLAGSVSFVVSIKSNDYNYEEKFHLPVNPQGVEHTLHLSLSNQKKVQLASLVPQDWLKPSLRYTIKVSNLPYMSQLSNIQQLIRYPYGCLEQTTSSTMPLLGIKEILPFLDDQSARDRVNEVKDMVQSGIERLLSMQNSRGGFGYWVGATDPNYWGTAYATNLLLEAKQLGYSVPEGSLKEALDYLEREIKVNAYRPGGYGYYHSNSSPFAIYVLAKGGRKVSTSLRDSAREFDAFIKTIGTKKWFGMDLENYFLLAAAAKLAGDREALKWLADRSLYVLEAEGSIDHYYSYWSPLRSDGMRLSIMEDVWPNSTEAELLATRVAKKLESKAGYYYSTQEMAWGIIGLGKRLKGLKRVSTDDLKKAKLSVGGKTLKAASEVSGGPIYTLGADASGEIAVSGVKANEGVWIYMDITGYTKSPPKGMSHLKIIRTFQNREGRPIALTDVKVGDVVYVTLSISNNEYEEAKNLAIVDRIPAGFEIENTRLGRGEELEWAKQSFTPEYMDIRDDRVQFFGHLRGNEKNREIHYSMRAVTPGKYTAPAPMIEAMYDPNNFDYGLDEPVVIR